MYVVFIGWEVYKTFGIMEENNIWQSHYWHCQEWTLKIDFEGQPINNSVPNISYKSEEIKTISREIVKLLQKGVIIECEREQGDFLSAVFTRKKKDGNMRTILKIKISE